MNTPNTCPCCSNSLIHHLGSHREYWFCRHCWSEMPNLKVSQKVRHPRAKKIVNLPITFSKLDRMVLVS